MGAWDSNPGLTLVSKCSCSLTLNLRLVSTHIPNSQVWRQPVGFNFHFLPFRAPGQHRTQVIKFGSMEPLLWLSPLLLFIFLSKKNCVCVWNNLSFGSPGQPGSCYADQASYEYTEIHLCLLSTASKGVCHHACLSPLLQTTDHWVHPKRVSSQCFSCEPGL